MKTVSIFLACIFAFALAAAPAKKKASVKKAPVKKVQKVLTAEQKEANAKKAEASFKRVLANLKKDPGFMKLATTPAPLYSTHRKRFAAKTAQAKADKEKVKILFLGDSITHGWDGTGKVLYKKHFAPYHALNLGFNGNRTEHVLWTVEKSGVLDHIKPELILMMIGTNNLSRSYSPEAVAKSIGMIKESLRKRYPQAKIVLYGIFPREGNVAHPLRLLIARTNDLISAYADNKNVFYEYIGYHMLTPGGYLERKMMADLLHPRVIGYEIWKDSIMKYVNKYVGKK